jgi:hypothetical protein
MNPRICAQCGAVILDHGIDHRRRHFCSDECCERFEDLFMKCGEPDPADLESAALELAEVEFDEDIIAGRDDDDPTADDLDDDLAADLDDDLELDLGGESEAVGPA